MKLSSIILENYEHFRKLADKLENELRDTYNRDDIHVSMGAYSGDRAANDPLRDKGFGKVSIHITDKLPDSEYRNMKNTLTAKGFEITGGANFYDLDDIGGKAHKYPSIKFHFDI